MRLLASGGIVPEETTRVALTIATRGRPEGCRRLVEAVLGQELPSHWELRVIVVDNNPHHSRLDLPHDPRLEVIQEVRPGIPLARNRGLEQALPWADVVTFVDDDEVPASESWLLTLVEGLDRYEADVVSGPVRPVFPPGTPAWIAEHPVFERASRRSGEPLSATYTANTASRGAVFRDGRRFDPTLQFTGGSDTLLFREAHEAGARLRWVAQAGVNESVPAERARVRWILARSFRIGANRIQFLHRRPTSTTRWLAVMAGSGAEMLLGLFAPVIAIASRRHALMLLGRGVRGVGAYAALFGVRYTAYR